jgi:hypothetical protein
MNIDRNGCPCTIVDPCRSSCTCANPVMSGGCACCAKYGNDEQRRKNAQRIRDILVGKQGNSHALTH